MTTEHRVPGRVSERAGHIIIAVCALFTASVASADAVTEWNAIMETTVGTVDPFLQVRTSTITQLAVHDAVNSIIGDYEPYVGKISADERASPDAAAIAAAHRALVALHPDHAAHLNELRSASLATIPEGEAKEAGVAVGVVAADAILAMRMDDGSEVITPYTPTMQPGRWRPTPPDLAPAFRPGMGKVIPFAIEHGAQFRAAPPPRLQSRRYVRDYDEVKMHGDINSPDRTQDRTDVARFYGVTDAVALWHPAARQVSEAQGKTLAENARIFALLSMAICDAAIAVFESKYLYDYWRPITAIRAGAKDGNRRTDADPDWTALIDTPPFPSYPSGHAGFGAAARRVLEEVFGPNGHVITLASPLLPGVVLHYTSWRQITDDVDDARVFGGVHFRFDQEGAARQGRRVGAHVLRHELRPVRDCRCDADEPRRRQL